MDVFLTIIAVIVIFSLLVLIHECGHFFAARSVGIKVLEFGIGFPPRLFKKKIGETVYSINAIPFGGFVKMFGEDAASDESVVSNKKSFAYKTPWQRTKVIVAGVVMNFILAIALLTVGFSFGIEPLLVTEQDLFAHLEQGNVVTLPGVFVGKLDKEAQALGLEAGDQIIAIDGKPIITAEQTKIFGKGKAKKDIDLTIVQAQTKQTKNLHVPLVGKDNHFGISLKPFTEFPRLAIVEVKPRSASAKAGLAAGDVILQMNSEEIYFPSDFETVLSEVSSVDFTVMRGNQVLQIPVSLPDAKKVVIADVFADSAAEAAGFKRGDIIVSMDGISLSDPRQVQEIVKKNPGKTMAYKIYRGGKEEEIFAKSGNGNVLGIALSSAASFRNTEISVYRTSIITSVMEIKKVRYGPWTAFKQALSESWRLTGLTVKAFGKTLGTIISKFTVPAEIGGPVQIAYYTHTFVQEGFFALLRFTALLSLSLAVINILPIPAMDGGRLLFVIVEVITRRRVNARLESLVHSIGFVLLIGLILLVTWSDIVRLF